MRPKVKKSCSIYALLHQTSKRSFTYGFYLIEDHKLPLNCDQFDSKQFTSMNHFLRLESLKAIFSHRWYINNSQRKSGPFQHCFKNRFPIHYKNLQPHLLKKANYGISMQKGLQLKPLPFISRLWVRRGFSTFPKPTVFWGHSGAPHLPKSINKSAKNMMSPEKAFFQPDFPLKSGKINVSLTSTIKKQTDKRHTKSAFGNMQPILYHEANIESLSQTYSTCSVAM